MPTINRPKKKPVKQGRSKEASEIYNTSKWRKLRNSFLMMHPICQMCLEEEKRGERDTVNLTEEIHHIKPILKGKDRLEMESIAFSANNLIALCKYHHHQIHNQLRN